MGDTIEQTNGLTGGSDAAPAPAARVSPTGMISPGEAARLFGVNVSTWYVWESAGKVPPATWVPRPHGGGRAKFYPADEVERLRQTMGAGVFPPPGTVDRHGAAAMFGVSTGTWGLWEREGRVPDVGRIVSVLGKAGAYKVYPITELERIKRQMDGIKQEIERQLEPYEDPDHPGCYRVPIVSEQYADKAALIDAVDLPLVQGKRWNWSGASPRRPDAGSVVLSGAGGQMLARMILRADKGDGRLVCHLNGDRLDCRRENLVLRTPAEVRNLAKRPAKWDRVGEAYPDPDRPGIVRVPVCSDVHEGMEALIDADALPLVRGKRLNWAPGKREGEGALILVNDRRDRVQLHQAVMGVRGKEYRVGHLNGDPLDCQRANLVVRTHSEQKAATRKVMVKAGKRCSSQYKGVSRASPTARWTVSIKADSEVRQLGRFRSEIAAALAYDDAAREVFGEHAQLNFSDPDQIAQMRARAAEEENAPPPAFPPPGFIDRRGACRMFGIGFKAWEHWERTGRVRCGQWAPQPLAKRGGKCRIYPIDELDRLLEQFNNIGKPYPDPERRGCCRVPIRSMIHRMEAIIDAEDLPLVEGRYWNWSPRSDRSSARVLLATTGKQVPLARLIARVNDPEQKVSHLNRDPLDCRRANLVVRTMAEQAPANRKMGTVNGRKYTSNFKGVSWDASRGTWKAQISKGDMHRHIGRFGDEVAAAQAYDEAARELFGEHAWLNFPDGVDAWLEQEARRSETEQREAA